MSYTFMYWFTRLDNLHELFCTFTAFSAFFLMISTFFTIIDEPIVTRKYFVFAIAALLFATSGAILIPTQKEAAAIYLIPKIANSEQVSSVTNDAYSIIRLKLKEYLNDISKKKSK